MPPNTSFERARPTSSAKPIRWPARRSSQPLDRMAKLVANINKSTLSVEISQRKRRSAISIPLDRDEPARPVAGELAHRVLFEVLYPAVYRSDRRNGKPHVLYSLFPPDPWLVVTATIMWEGILQGLSWDAVKVLCRSALAKLRQANQAPLTDKASSVSTGQMRVGFRWTEYASGRKQRELFVGLERCFRREKSKVKGVRSNKSLERTRDK